MQLYYLTTQILDLKLITNFLKSLSLSWKKNLKNTFKSNKITFFNDF